MSDQATTNDAVIRFTDVHKSFGDNTVLKGFTMELQRGRTLAIMGPSGVGKSVILKHAIGILTADSGSVEIFGQEMSQISNEDPAQIRQRIRYLFQQGALITWPSAGDYVALPLP